MPKIFKLLLCCLLAAGLQPVAQAQENCILLPTPEQIDYLNRTKEARQNFVEERTSAIRWIPVQFHNCVTSLGGIDPVNYTGHLDRCMSDLNRVFLPYNIQFYECGALNTFINGTLYGFDATEEPQLAAYDVPNVINIYFFGNVTQGGSSYCGYSYLPPSADRVIFNKSCIGTGTTEIFLHEMGHYFSLYHTHGKSNTVRTDELVNGSNCAVAGDDVCDTPADPNLFRSAGMMSGCTYIGTMNDANGQPYRPDPSNYMSYGPINCRTGFSPQQMSRMAYSANFDRAYLTGCPHPNNCSTPISALPVGFDFENGLEGWSNAWIEPQFSVPMLVGSGATPTPNTGPDAAFSGNNYVYAEASTNVNAYERYAVLRSPCFDLRGYAAPKMSMRYHAYGLDIGDVAVQVSTDGGYDWWSLPQQTLFYATTGSLGNQWNYLELDLTPFNTAQSFQVRIGCQIFTGYEEGDFAVDDIRFYNAGGSTCMLYTVPIVQNIGCNGTNSGQIALQTVGPNAAAATYNWSNGATSASLSGLAAGTYAVTVTDGQGCTTTASATVLEPPALVATINSVNQTMPGVNNGSVAASAGGGTAPYFYAWSNGATSSSIANLAPGTYTATISDASACSTVKTAMVLPVPPPVCATTFSAFPYTQSFEQNFGIFERASGYNTNWVRRSGATPNQNTGPNSAYNGNVYAFINSSTYAMTAVLRTKDCLNLTGVTNPVLEFYFHMSGAQMGTLFVEVSVDNGVTWATPWSVSGDMGAQWTKGIVNLQPFNNGATRIRFRGLANGGRTSDMAIDAVYIGPAGVNQLEPLPVTQSVETSFSASIYPNPSDGAFIFEANRLCESVEVFNQTGASVWRADAAGKIFRIDLGNQPNGLYFLRSRSGEDALVKKLLLFDK
jgi:MAM domain, meprin/A5/mu/Secretion system C-terminal sorting domain/Pregnancy-associated plasma protein-A